MPAQDKQQRISHPRLSLERIEEAARVTDPAFTNTERSIIEAMNLLLDEIGLVVEPAGVAGVAAALQFRDRFAATRAATPLCGGNVTAEQIRNWQSTAVE